MGATIIQRHDPPRLCPEQHQRLAQESARQRPVTQFLWLSRDVPGVVYVHDEILSLQVEAYVEAIPAGQSGHYRVGARGVREVITDRVVAPVSDVVGENSRLPTAVVAIPGQSEVGHYVSRQLGSGEVANVVVDV